MAVVFVISMDVCSAEQPQKPELDRIQLVGFRPFDATCLILDPEDKKASIPSELIFRAGSESQALKEYLAAKGTRFPAMDQMIPVLRTESENNIWQKLNNSKSTALDYLPPFSKAKAKVDADFVVALTHTELFSRKYPLLEQKDQVEGIPVVAVEPNAALLLANAYALLSQLEGRYDTASATTIAACNGILEAQPRIAQAARVEFGGVSIGRPLIVSAETKGVRRSDDIPKSAALVWIQCFITLDKDYRDTFEHFSILLDITPTTATSLVLTPVSGRDSGSIGTVIVPDEVLGPFKSEVPKVSAGGLRENRVFWTLQEKALDLGSKQFATVAMVPAETSELELNVSFVAQTKPNFFVKSHIVAGSRPWTKRIPVPGR